MLTTPYNKENILIDLINTVGKENVTIEECDLVCYEKDYSLISDLVQIKPDFVVQPETTQHVSEIVRLANRWKIPIVPWGGGTGMWGGAIPSDGGIVLDMRKMNRIINLDEEKRTVTVQSGVLVKNLADHLEKRGFFVADKPESWFSATVGARTQVNGIGCYYNSRFGQSTDQVICLEVVLPTGEIVRTGALKVCTPASGYDFTSLFSNAEGTLGIVTEVSLRIYKLPERRLVEIFEFPSYRSMIEAVMAIRDSGLIPETLETMDRTNYQSYFQNEHRILVSNERVSKFGGVMVIGYAGIDKLIESQIKVTRDICDRYQGKLTPNSLVEAYKSLKETYPVNPFPIHTALKGKPVKYVLDAIVPLESTTGLIELYHNLVDEHRIASYGIAAVHCAPDFHSAVYAKAYVDEREEKEIDTVRKIEAELYNYVKNVGGGIGGSGGIGISKLPYGEDQYESTLSLAKKLKQTLDPNNIINPGKKLTR